MTKDKLFVSSKQLFRDNEVLNFVLSQSRKEIESDRFGFILSALELVFKRTTHIHDVVTMVARSYTFDKTDRLEKMLFVFLFSFLSKDFLTEVEAAL